LEKIAWLYRICVLYEYFCIIEIKGDAMVVIRGIGVKDEKGTPNVSGRT